LEDVRCLRREHKAHPWPVAVCARAAGARHLFVERLAQLLAQRKEARLVGNRHEVSAHLGLPARVREGGCADEADALALRPQVELSEVEISTGGATEPRVDV